MIHHSLFLGLAVIARYNVAMFAGSDDDDPRTLGMRLADVIASLLLLLFLLLLLLLLLMMLFLLLLSLSP